MWRPKELCYVCGCLCRETLVSVETNHKGKWEVPTSESGGDIYLDIRVTQCIPCKFPSPQAVQKLPPSALKVDANSSMLRAFFIHAQIFRLLLKISVEKAISRASHYFFLVSPFRWDNRQNVKLHKSLVKRRRQARAQRKSMQGYLMWRGINTNQWVFQINKSEWRPTSFSTTNENPWQ